MACSYLLPTPDGDPGGRLPSPAHRASSGPREPQHVPRPLALAAAACGFHSRGGSPCRPPWGAHAPHSGGNLQLQGFQRPNTQAQGPPPTGLRVPGCPRFTCASLGLKAPSVAALFKTASHTQRLGLGHQPLQPNVQE